MTSGATVLSNDVSQAGAPTDGPAPVRRFLAEWAELSASRTIYGIFMYLGVLFSAPIFARATSTGWQVIATALAALTVLSLPVIAIAILHVRRLLAAGYDRSDLLWALRCACAENAFCETQQSTRLSQAGRALIPGGALGGTLLVVSTLLIGQQSGPLSLIPLIGVALGIALVTRGMVRGLGSRALTATRLSFWRDSFTARFLFRIAAIAVERREDLSDARSAPTEAVLAASSLHLFETLPEGLRRSLRALPVLVNQLASEGQRLAGIMTPLPFLETSVTEGNHTPGEEVDAALQPLRERRTAAVSALERIRNGLLRLHAGTTRSDDLANALAVAEEISEDLTMTLEAQGEVDRALL